MDETEKKLLEELRALHVKAATFHIDNFGARRIASVEFNPAPQFGSLDIDTIIPPAPASDTERPPAPPKLAPALSRVLKRGSVS